MSRFSLFLFFASLASFANAQIGYQVAVVDQTTGEPKANTDVSVTVTITDNAGGMITTSSQSATTNDFGVISLQIGNESTFANTDWTKLPLWIAATVDGVSLGKTQILTVPVAEHAKHTGVLTKKKLKRTWSCHHEEYTETYAFTETTCVQSGWNNSQTWRYYIQGNIIVLIDGKDSDFLIYVPEINALVQTYNGYVYR